MQITWYGQSCFKIVSGQTTIILDPFGKDTGLTPPRGKADVLLVSDSNLKPDDYSQINADFVVCGAGEYEIGGVNVEGMSVFNMSEKGEPIKISTMYVFDIEKVRVCHLSDFSEEQVLQFLDKIGQVDILMVPVGGDYTIGKEKVKSLNFEKAVEVISEIDPRLVIPMNFKIPGLKVDLDSVDKFLKAVGFSGDAKDKISIKKKDLPQEGRDIVLMKLS